MKVLSCRPMDMEKSINLLRQDCCIIETELDNLSREVTKATQRNICLVFEFERKKEELKNVLEAVEKIRQYEIDAEYTLIALSNHYRELKSREEYVLGKVQDIVKIMELEATERGLQTSRLANQLASLTSRYICEVHRQEILNEKLHEIQVKSAINDMINQIVGENRKRRLENNGMGLQLLRIIRQKKVRFTPGHTLHEFSKP
ncbi:hypothetical protein ACOME3_004352 [Neoechinorhynchus agilis]